MAKFKTVEQALGIRELKSIGLYRALAAEFLGTFILVFVGISSSVSLNNTAVAFTFGITLASVIQMLGHVSGAHVNPSVSTGMFCAREITLMRWLLYIVVQILGALTGYGVLYGIVPENSREGLGIVSTNIEAAQAFGMELVMTFVFVMLILASTDERRKDVGGSVPLAIGLALAAILMGCIPWSGGGINPARVMAPLIVIGGDWSYHWVYWVGDLLGASVAGFLYTFVFRAPKVLPGIDRL